MNYDSTWGYILRNLDGYLMGCGFMLMGVAILIAVGKYESPVCVREHCTLTCYSFVDSIDAPFEKPKTGVVR